MTDPAGAEEPRSEPSGDAHRHPFRSQHARRGVDAADAVLDRQHRGIGTEDAPCGARRVGDVADLGGEDRQVARAGIARVRRGPDAHGAASAGPFDAQTALPDRGDVGRVDIDRPDLVSGGAEQPRIDRPHRPRADDRDLHAPSPRAGRRRLPPTIAEALFSDGVGGRVYPPHLADSGGAQTVPAST